MKRYRSFLFPEGQVMSEDALILDPRESYHLVRVLRARVGQEVEVLNGQGCIYRGRIEKANAKGTRIAIDSIEEISRPKLKVTLVQAIPKGKAMDLILRMATEIGVSMIQPVFTDHGEVQIANERLASKVEKWRLSMIEACKQCGLAWLPELVEPVSFRKWQDQKPEEGRLRIVASLESGGRPLAELLKEHSDACTFEVAVGPEGDFSTLEYQNLSEVDFKSVRLGANVLRVDTAAAYILSVIDQWGTNVSKPN